MYFCSILCKFITAIELILYHHNSLNRIRFVILKSNVALFNHLGYMILCLEQLQTNVVCHQSYKINL